MARGDARTKKYWLAGNPNAEITNAEVTALGEQTATELDLLDGAVAGTVAASKAVIYSSAGGVVGYPSIEALANAPGAATVLPANGGLLVKNTYYAEDTTNGDAFLLPTIANSTAGDWIVIRDTAGIANNEKITVGSAANGDFALGSHITGINVTATASTEAVDIAVSGDNSVILEGETNGCGGVGSYIALVFNGSNWVCSGVARNIGDGSVSVIGAGGFHFAATA